MDVIVAVSRNGVIGREGKLPWRLPSDMAHFKELTTGQIVIMGRKTYESIPPKFRPLPERTNIVLSRTMTEPPHQEVILAQSLDEALERYSSEPTKKVFVIGGVEVYKEALPKAKKLFLTRIEAEVEGDAFFPYASLKFWKREWELEEASEIFQGEKDQYPISFRQYRRRG